MDAEILLGTAKGFAEVAVSPHPHQHVSTVIFFFFFLRRVMAH